MTRKFYRLRLAFCDRVDYPAAVSRMRKQEPIVPIILAAGSSQELTFPKALARFGAKTALDIAVKNCQRIGRPVVVLGSDAKLIRKRVPRAADVVINRNWQRGQLSSLRRALKQIPKGSAFLLYPVDLPLLTGQTIHELLRAFRARKVPQEIVMPRHNGKYGHPVIVSAALRRELFTAKTAREVIYRLPGRIRVVRVRTDSIYVDFHTLASYRKCLRRFLRR